MSYGYSDEMDRDELDPPTKTRAQLGDAKTALNYILAGNAKVTLVSKKTGTRFTYQVRKPADKPLDYAQQERTKAYMARQGQRFDPKKPRKILFVSLLTGPDNWSNYTYLGQIFPDELDYSHGRKSRISQDAPSAKAFNWFWSKLQVGDIPEQLEVWHEGSCGKCGRSLTDPESIARGIGPVCAAGA